MGLHKRCSPTKKQYNNNSSDEQGHIINNNPESTNIPPVNKKFIMPYSDRIGYSDHDENDSDDEGPLETIEMTGIHRTSDAQPSKLKPYKMNDDDRHFHNNRNLSSSSSSSTSCTGRRILFWTISVVMLLFLMTLAWMDDSSSSSDSSSASSSSSNKGNDHKKSESLIKEVINVDNTNTQEGRSDEVDDEKEDSGGVYSIQSKQETKYFELTTGNARIDIAYQLAISEIQQNIVTKDPITNQTVDQPYFIAGNGWTQLWTRDTSYAIELGLGLLHPDIAMQSLMGCTEIAPVNKTYADGSSEVNNRTVWLQDTCSHFGGWPNLSDAIVGARGAWYLYLYTGNHTFLEWAYYVTVGTIQRAEHDVKRKGLFRGCSSFMESNSGYPLKYKSNGKLVGKTNALSTNMLYYNGYQLAAKMGSILLDDSEFVGHLQNQANFLKDEIRNRLWMEDLGYYSYFLDENDEVVEQMEGLGEALVLLTDEFEDSSHRIRSMLEHTYRTDIGIPCLWPRFDHGDDIPFDDDHVSFRYHNGRIWPFVSGYYAIAAARKGRMDIFAEEMIRLIDLSEQENTFAEFYELDKSFPEFRRRQLWSDTGYLGMVYQGLFGMVFEIQGITFAPSKPYPQDFLEMEESISLLNVKYRKAIVDIHVTGWGNRIESFKINGEGAETPLLEATATGKHVIEIAVTAN